MTTRQSELSYKDDKGSGSEMCFLVSLALPAKAKGVKLQGYESDSGDDEEDPTQIGAADDADDDMFSSAPKPAKVDDTDRIKDSGLELKGGASKANKEFLDLDDIEGQEFGRKPEEDAIPESVKMVVEEGSDVEGSEEDFVSGDEMANTDEAPRSRRTKRGMGYVISRFNMKDEMEEGRFNTEGSEFFASPQWAGRDLKLANLSFHCQRCRPLLGSRRLVDGRQLKA
jgi:CD2 antigen cytoplasmic tail-binding protein 2